MRILLDTCTFLWLAADAEEVSPRGLPNIHWDPIDRGLVSTAILQGLTILTPAPQIARYPAPTLW